LDGLKLKIGFKSAETVQYTDFDLSGAVEKREPAASPNKDWLKSIDPDDDRK
jgi:hypothetical protein